MIFYYLDASAWVKRYYWETGTTWVQSPFARGSTVACASLGLVEVMATLARKAKAIAGTGMVPLGELIPKFGWITISRRNTYSIEDV